MRADGTQPFDKRLSVPQHFELMHHQLTQIRNALALAQALGRILILPRLVCGLDRWWAPHAGIIPGSAARLPLLECPADHVIDLERMGKPEKVLREAGMLCNPRTPASVLKSQRNASLPAVDLSVLTLTLTLTLTRTRTRTRTLTLTRSTSRCPPARRPPLTR